MFFNLAIAKSFPVFPSSPSNFTSGLSIKPKKSGGSIVSPLLPTTNSAAPKLAALNPTLASALEPYLAALLCILESLLFKTIFKGLIILVAIPKGKPYSTKVFVTCSLIVFGSLRSPPLYILS